MYFRWKTGDYFRSNFSSIQTLMLRFGYLWSTSNCACFLVFTVLIMRPIPVTKVNCLYNSSPPCVCSQDLSQLYSLAKSSFNHFLRVNAMKTLSEATPGDKINSISGQTYLFGFFASSFENVDAHLQQVSLIATGHPPSINSPAGITTCAGSLGIIPGQIIRRCY